MRRTYLVVAGIVAVLLLAAGAWWLARLAESRRPPDIFGKVEAVHADRGCVTILLRLTKPNTPGWDSELNADNRRWYMKLRVHVQADKVIHRRSGEVGELTVGQTVSAWCEKKWKDTYPPQGLAHFVIIEPDDW